MDRERDRRTGRFRLRIVTVRRVSQVFFAVLFLGLAAVATFGENLWQLRGWPINLFLELDPLIAIATVLTTGTLYAGLAWAVLTIVMSAFLGRAFCGWVCPFGTMHQFFGWVGKATGLADRVRMNRPSRFAAVKYYILAFLLAGSATGLVARAARATTDGSPLVWLSAGVVLVVGAVIALAKPLQGRGRSTAVVLVFAVTWIALGRLVPDDETFTGSIQIGILDPIAFLTRATQVIALPFLDRATGIIFVSPRYTAGAWLIGGLFGLALLLNLMVPRFYCRYVCPLGALLGILGRFAPWRIRQDHQATACRSCRHCESDCEGACDPSGMAGGFVHSECVLCMNCLDDCSNGVTGFGAQASDGKERPLPDIGRRGLLISLASGVAVVPVIRLAGNLGPTPSAGQIRPPGALPEDAFLDRCLKCGQCMRICPTNVLQPAGFDHGLEALWTPVLNNRIGTSGCQLNCTACSMACPTAAIRPITLDEKLGRGDFASKGPIRVGMAYVDRGLCLPWAMDRPCIVCEENCPVSPKAIYAKTVFDAVRGGTGTVRESLDDTIALDGVALTPGGLATGDYFLAFGDGSGVSRLPIRGNMVSAVVLLDAPARPFDLGSDVRIEVRLKQPYVDPKLCTGCGICEHECPVSGIAAIRVIAENESRHSRSTLIG